MGDESSSSSGWSPRGIRLTGRPELPADALGTSGSSSWGVTPDPWGGLLALLPVGITLTPLLPPLPLVGLLLPVVPLLPVRGVLDLPPVVEGTAGTGALMNIFTLVNKHNETNVAKSKQTYLMAAVGPGKSSGTIGFPLTRDSLDGGVVG